MWPADVVGIAKLMADDIIKMILLFRNQKSNISKKKRVSCTFQRAFLNKSKLSSSQLCLKPFLLIMFFPKDLAGFNRNISICVRVLVFLPSLVYDLNALFKLQTIKSIKEDFWGKEQPPGCLQMSFL